MLPYVYIAKLALGRRAPLRKAEISCESTYLMLFGDQDSHALAVRSRIVGMLL